MGPYIFYWREGVIYTSQDPDRPLDRMSLSEAASWACDVGGVVRLWPR